MRRSVPGWSRFITAACVAVMLLLVVPVGASCFSIPERLEYDVSWVGIHAGSAVLSIVKSGENYVIESQATSADYLSLFYRVEDMARSVVEGSEGGFGYPLSYKLRIREGRHRKDKEVVFDRKAGKAVYTNLNDGKAHTFSVDKDVHDPLSGFFSLRNRPMEVGVPVKIRIFDSKKTWDVDVEVLRRERIKVPAGTFNTIMIKPNLKSEGIFLRRGDVYIWLTDDQRKIPVMVRTKVTIGHVTAELRSPGF